MEFITLKPEENELYSERFKSTQARRNQVHRMLEEIEAEEQAIWKEIRHTYPQTKEYGALRFDKGTVIAWGSKDAEEKILLQVNTKLSELIKDLELDMDGWEKMNSDTTDAECDTTKLNQGTER